MLAVLINKLSIEIIEPLNASFFSELKKMQETCKQKLTALLKNDFLVMATYLDPRYTVQIERIVSKRFHECIDTFIEAIKDYRKEEQLQNQIDTEVNVIEAFVEPSKYDFWDFFDPSEPNSEIVSSQQELKHQLEVSF